MSAASFNTVAFRGTQAAAAIRLRHYGLSNPEIRLSSAGIPRSFSTNTSFWKKDVVSSLMVISAITFVFCATVFVGSLRHRDLPDILGGSYSDSSYSAYAPSDKDSFLTRMKSQDRRKLAAQVHYVGEIIRSVRSKADEINKMAYAIVLESRKVDLDPLFVAAVIKSESAFNHKALSYAGALGLMQLMPDTARYVSKRSDLDWHGNSKLKDPYYNIKLGVAYLRYLDDTFKGNRELTLIAYNWGPSNLEDALKNRSSVPSSSKKYAKTIISDHARWRADFAARLPEFQYLNLSNIG